MIIIIERWRDKGMERFFALHAVMRGAEGVGKPVGFSTSEGTWSYKTKVAIN
ncbi:hypothetical protein [Ulvibacterium marinum]|uniref:hypothetical protein n=1 Tax=Ulvibacterium marinum TaxID=2419782 RepID=UPI002495904D|nr:hypothetical protein [Ulvibacterium marinum]